MKNSSVSILVLGSNGLVGSALCRGLELRGYKDFLVPKRQELDLLDQKAVFEYLNHYRPQWIFLAAAKVGGIMANSTYPAEFIHQNLTIASNVIHGAYLAKCEKLLFLGSSCIYPKNPPIPIKEEYLLTGPLEKTNEAYAVSKIAGLKMAEFYRQQYGCNFFSVMPTNLYGPKDRYHPDNSHVIPGLIERFVQAYEKKLEMVKVWGTGNPLREFLHVDDLASGLIFLMNSEKKCDGLINIGSGEEISIRDLSQLIVKKVNYKGKIEFDSSKPDGTMRKLLDSSKIRDLGWKPSISLEQGLEETIQAYIADHRI